MLKAYFRQVRWLACISEIKSYAISSQAAGRAIHAGKVWSNLSDKQRYPGPAGLKLRHRADNPNPQQKRTENPQTSLARWNQIRWLCKHNVVKQHTQILDIKFWKTKALIRNIRGAFLIYWSVINKQPWREVQSITAISLMYYALIWCNMFWPVERAIIRQYIILMDRLFTHNEMKKCFFFTQFTSQLCSVVCVVKPKTNQRLRKEYIKKKYIYIYI